MLIKSTLEDDHHDLGLYLEIELETCKILEIESYTRKIPFKDCALVKDILHKMKGMRVKPGVKRAYHDNIPRADSCTHFTEIFIATVDFIFARLYGPETRAQTPEQRAKVKKRNADLLILNNGCLIFNQKNKALFDEKGNYKGKSYHY